MDLVRTSEDLVAVEAMVKDINSEAVIIHTQQSCVDIKTVLNRGVYRDKSWAEKWSGGNDMDVMDRSGTRDTQRSELQNNASSHSDGEANVSEPSPSEAMKVGCSREASQEAEHVRQRAHTHTDIAGTKTVALRCCVRLNQER